MLRNPSRCTPAVAAVLGLILASDPLAAATVSWPSASCAGTLQACIDGAASGDRIEIAAAGPIDENIVIASRSLTLTSSAGLRPRFASGRRIVVTAGSGATPVSVSISRVQLLDGYIEMLGGSAAATFEVRDVDVRGVSSGVRSNIRIAAGTSSTATALLRDNRVSGIPDSINSGLIELRGAAGQLDAQAINNRVTRTDSTGDGGGIVVDVYSVSGAVGSGAFRLFGNEVRGNFNRGSIFVSEGMFSSTPSTLSALLFNNVVVCPAGTGNGITHTVKAGVIYTQTVNNTISGCRNGINALRWEGAAATSRVNGYLWNNLVVATNSGVELNASLTPDLANDYNLINAPANSFTPGSHTLTAAAQLVDASAPRLKPVSPAINAADGAFLANALIEAGFPALDADGLRRVKGGSADIGAYEYGDLSTLHVAISDALTGGNTSTYITRVDNPASNGQPAALLLPTRIYGPAGPRSAEPYGVYYHAGTSRWAIYNESFANVAFGLRWSAFVPASGSGTFVHAGSAANTTDWHTTIDNSSTNGYADRIVLVAHNWSAATTYNAHPIGLYYSGSGAAGRWNIANTDQAVLPVSNAFNVYAQAPSQNAFRIAATPGLQRVEIDHPLANGVACATLHVSRVVAASSPGPVGSFDLDYFAASGRWAIYSPVPWPIGTSFNVVIDPAQIFTCSDRIFQNGFD